MVTFDKRGQGLSDRMSGAPSLEVRMDDVRAIMDAIGSKRAALIGFSEGGCMSVLFAATYPERVSHLVLIGCFSRSADRFVDDAWEARLEQIVKDWGAGELIKTVAPSEAGKPERCRAIRKVRAVGEQPRRVADDLAAQPPDRCHRNSADAAGADAGPAQYDRSSSAGRARPQARRRDSGFVKYIEYHDRRPRVLDRRYRIQLGDIEEFITGHRDIAPAELERVLATVLFTDIVDSTRSAAAMGDQRWRRLLDDHDQLAQQLVGRHRGNLVKSTGDGLLATFDGPGRAVRCALAFGSAAQEIGLPLRAGLHTGEIEIRGNDIGGIAVHAAARVMSHSGSDEVLVSRVVTDLVAGAGLKFAERGSFELKGLPGRWDLFAASG